MTNGSTRREYLKRTGTFGTASIALLSGCLGGGGSSTGTEGTDTATGTKSKPTTWVIGGSQEGSPYNTWVQGMASELKKHSDKLRLSPQFVNGFQSAFPLLENGTIDIGSSWYHLTAQSQNNTGVFKKGNKLGSLQKNFRGLTPVVHHGFWYFTTYANRDEIKTINDLEGKRVGLNVPDAGVTQWAKQLLNIAGVDANYSFLSIGDAGSAIQSKQVDAALFLAINGAILPGPMKRAYNSVDMKGVQIPSDVANELQKKHPVVQYGTVTQDKLKSMKETESVRSFLLSSGEMTTADKDADLVYEFVSTIMENADDLGQYHPALKMFGLGEGHHGFKGVPDDTKFHKGAVRYYEEEGIDYPGK